MTINNDPLNQMLKLPSGARFYRCALQVNPYAYLKQHSKSSSFASEDDYNTAIVNCCLREHIEVIAVTDHHRIDSSLSLLQKAIDAGIVALPGFEAGTKEGVHILCVFDATRTANEIRGILGNCGVTNPLQPPTCCDLDVLEFLERARYSWNAVCIAAHVTKTSGLLSHLKGQSAINAWRSPDLFACSTLIPVEQEPDNFRQILLNKDPNYRRDRPVAIINAKDVNGPDELMLPGATCWIKMQGVSIEGLRQAFLDPASRVRLASDPVPEEHVEIIGAVWQGGFLDGQALHLNENLNVLIGGRGTGKSTVVESLRHVLGLEPLGKEATAAHDGIVKQVLKSGTKVSLLVRTYRPSRREYRIDRTIPNPAVVRDDHGQVLNITPSDLLPQVEVYGQHEISELTKSPEKLTRLLERFMERDSALTKRKSDLVRHLEKSRNSIIDLKKEIQIIADQLASLPVLEETLVRFQQAGLEDKLKEQSLLVREDRILKTIPTRLETIEDTLDQLSRQLPIDKAFLSDKALEGLPGREIIKRAASVFDELNNSLSRLLKEMIDTIGKAKQQFESVSSSWSERKSKVQSDYERILRDLQKASVDGEEFIRLRQRIEELRPLKEKQALLKSRFREAEQKRRQLLAEWDDVKAEEFRQFEKAANKVNNQLKDRVRVTVAFQGEREQLFALLKSIGGRLQEAIDILKKRDSLSLKELADTLRSSIPDIQLKYSLTKAQAERLASGGDDVLMRVEELDLGHTTDIELNTAAEGAIPVWQSLNELSTGQKATAVLLLLLLESDAPLIVDQPEDDLDNRFITDGIVPRMREEKRRRQFIFATHNANIPVLGDAELIAGLSASGEAALGHADIQLEHMGSIDTPQVKELVEELLEGGKEAFEMRRLKYGY